MIAISRSRGRRAVRTTLAAGAVALGLTALTGCEKPSHAVQFTVGSSTKNLETTGDCYGKGEPLGVDQFNSCMEGAEPDNSLSVDRDATVRIGVSPDTADTGWLVFADQNPMYLSQLSRAVTPVENTYLSLPAEEIYQAVTDEANGQLPPETVRLSVVQVTDEYDTEAVLEAMRSDQEAFYQTFYGSLENVWSVELNLD